MASGLPSQSPNPDYLQELASRAGEDWPALFAARAEAREHLASIQGIVAALRPPANTSIVGFGSLAREEWSPSSDLDWTLLLDGPADMGHFGVAKSVGAALDAAGYPKPGPTGIFGGIASSHELVHRIGGSEDSNQNITSRMVLLLESAPLSDFITQERVIRAILQRYIVGDPPTSGATGFRVPLFLYNDVVRFWRTLAVDYAAKKWHRSNVGWALRNFKLRMSRKLLFAKGTLICFLCDREFSGKPATSTYETIESELVNLCFKHARRTAIDLLADTALRCDAMPVGAKLMRAYNEFLTTLRDPDKREKLAQLAFEDASDPFFDEQRLITRDFRDALCELFFDSNDRLALLTRRYGVF